MTEGRADRDALATRLLAQKDPEGLRLLLDDHHGKVRGALRKEFCKVLDDLEIDEALSQASQRIWNAGAAYDPARGSLPAWFLAIARNCARRVLECRRRHAALPLAEVVESEDVSGVPIVTLPRPESAASVARKRFLRDLYTCIERLPPQQRHVVLADLEAGGTAPTDEVAQALRTTPNSVYVSRTNGRKALREAMSRLGHMSPYGGKAPAGAVS